MGKQRFLNFSCMLWAVVILFLGVAQVRAQSSRVAEQAPRSHDEDAVIQRQANRMRSEQRIAAAARARAIREAADPTLAARQAEARDAAGRAAAARAAEIRDLKKPGAAARAKITRSAAAREARARAAASVDLSHRRN